MSRFLTRLSAFAALLFIACGQFPFQYEIHITAGNQDLHNSLLYIDLLIPWEGAYSAACVSDGSHNTPGQVEFPGNHIARVWWFEKELKAGESKDYTIFIGKKYGKNQFKWDNSNTGHDVLTHRNKPVFEYIHPVFNPANSDSTQKPWHHIYSPDGVDLLTKGEGGLHSHHRGLFFGYTRVTVGDSIYNTWYSEKNGYTQHEATISQMYGPVFGGHKVLINWNTNNGEPFAFETRSVKAFFPGDGTELIDFKTKLVAAADTVLLEGDRHHGGVQFRAAQQIADNPALKYFLRPEPWAQLPDSTEYNGNDFKNVPWNALCVTINNNDYTIVYMSDPLNPKPADFSERDYGRTGEYFPWLLTSSNPLTAHYWLWIVPGHSINRKDIEKKYSELTSPASVKLVKTGK